MSKALRTTLILAILISAAANAPGLLLALANSQEPNPAEAKAGASVAPVDYYAYDYDYDTTQTTPSEWLDALFQASNTQPVASWRHTWTDFESTPTADALNPFRRPAHWEPEGVLFAYLATFGDIGYTDLHESFANPSSRSVKSIRLTGFSAGAGGGSGKVDQGKGGQTPPDEQPDPDPIPDTDPPPPDEDVTPVPPIPDETDTDPLPHEDPPVTVPEPASMGLFAVGLAGLFMFGKRRRLSALARDGRDRA